MRNDITTRPCCYFSHVLTAFSSITQLFEVELFETTVIRNLNKMQNLSVTRVFIMSERAVSERN